MKTINDPFIDTFDEQHEPASADEPDRLRSQLLAVGMPGGVAAHPVVGRFDGFDLLDRPVVSGVPDFPGERLAARSTVALRHADRGREVVLMFEQGDPRRPLVMGLLGEAPSPTSASAAEVLADGERQLIQAERELVLRCGDASITLTRAGKVVIEGRYVLSRSSGYNKIKGAAVDIN